MDRLTDNFRNVKVSLEQRDNEKQRQETGIDNLGPLS